MFRYCECLNRNVMVRELMPGAFASHHATLAALDKASYKRAVLQLALDREVLDQAAGLGLPSPWEPELVIQELYNLVCEVNDFLRIEVVQLVTSNPEVVLRYCPYIDRFVRVRRLNRAFLSELEAKAGGHRERLLQFVLEHGVPDLARISGPLASQPRLHGEVLSQLQKLVHLSVFD